MTQAAVLLRDVVSGITLEKAKARVCEPASEGKFRTNSKTCAARRIDTDSFNTWRFEQREKDLARAD